MQHLLTCLQANLKNLLALYGKAVVFISAGKDSALLVKLLKDSGFADKLHFVWAAGNPTDEAMLWMEKLTKGLSFQAVLSDVMGDIAVNGFPVDFLPIGYTPLGQILTGKKAVKLQSAADCCYRNLWQPVYEIIAPNYVLIIRGDKSTDKLNPIVSSGATVDGKMLYFPLWDLSDQEVIEYLGEDIPPNYQRGAVSSLDCRGCTAYINDKQKIKEIVLTKESTVEATVLQVIHKILAEEATKTLQQLENIYGN